MAFMYPHHLSYHPFHEDFFDEHEMLETEKPAPNAAKSQKKKKNLDNERKASWVPHDHDADSTAMTMKLNLPNQAADSNEEDTSNSIADPLAQPQFDFTDEEQDNSGGDGEEMEIESQPEDDDDV
uniref:Uncharacterized protein n=1 Tax=Panagrolaimus sp. JU765 TaxID=591449 RepID=A0AC34R494_9BILA